jgi:regulator of RNase E activity RraA
MKVMHLANGVEIDERVRSAIISDSLDVIGIRTHVMSRNITPLAPNMKCIGFAATIEFIEDDTFNESDPYGEAIDFLDSLKPEDVAIIATNQSERSAFWGELFTTAAKSRGAHGMVTDGPLRDTREIEKIGFSVFGHGTLPFDFKGRCRVSRVNQSVKCGGVEVHPRDLIVADADGIAVVPQAHVAQVIGLANERVRRESTVLAELSAGSSVRKAWDRHRIL